MSRRAKLALRWAFVVTALALAGLALASDWERATGAIEEADPARLLASFLLGLGGLWFAYVSWRMSLHSLGGELPVITGARVFFIGQLGKYVPGSVWPVVMQADMAREHGVRRSQTTAAFPLTLLVSCLTGAGVAIATVPTELGDVPGRTGLLALPVLALLLHPRVLSVARDVAERVLRRPIPVVVPDWVALLKIGAATLAMWLLLGLHLVMLWPTGWPNAADLALALGAVALAWVGGLLVVFVPAGAGIREAVLLAILGPSVGTTQALVMALLSRVLLSVGDVALAGVFAKPVRADPAELRSLDEQ